MKNLLTALLAPLVLALPALALPALAPSAAAQTSTPNAFADAAFVGTQPGSLASVLSPDLSFERRHAHCLRAIADDPEAAYEVAITWVGRGGGYRAEHCTAMALFTLGHARESAERLEALAADFPETDAKLRRLRVDYLSQAAQGWLQADAPDEAYRASTAALDLEPADAAARITRARVYFALDRVDDAETDLTSVLAYHPDHAEALRYRADARLRLGELDAALEDAETSLVIAPSVDTALIRGHIRQAQALRDTSPETTP